MPLRARLPLLVPPPAASMARGRPGGGHTTAAHGSLVLLQFLYGGYHVLTKRALLRGEQQHHAVLGDWAAPPRVVV